MDPRPCAPRLRFHTQFIAMWSEGRAAAHRALDATPKGGQIPALAAFSWMEQDRAVDSWPISLTPVSAADPYALPPPTRPRVTVSVAVAAAQRLLAEKESPQVLVGRPTEGPDLKQTKAKGRPLTQ